jgi:hypothetical protein
MNFRRKGHFIFPLTLGHLVPLLPDDQVSALRPEEDKSLTPGEAAEVLGINPSTLRNRMNQFGIPNGNRRKEQ